MLNKSYDQGSAKILDHRNIDHPQLLLRGTALNASSVPATGTLERRTGALPEQLRGTLSTIIDAPPPKGQPKPVTEKVVMRR